MTCRAEGEGKIQYELLKDETEAFVFQLLESVVARRLLCVVLEWFVIHTAHSTLRM